MIMSHRPSPLRTPFGIFLLTALIPLACGGEAESAADEASVPAAEAAPVSDAPVEPVPPTVRPAPETPVEGALQPEPVVVAREPRPAPAPRPTGPPAAEATAPAEPAAPTRMPLFVPSGALLETTVEAELSTERNATGDRFYAILDEDVLGPNGEVLLAAGSRLNGRVAESRESAGPEEPAMLAVEVESISSAGRTLPLVAQVVELEAEVQARDSNTRTATKVGVGAAAGALIGRILGNDGKDAARGAVAGAAAGAAVAIATRDGHAVVRPGARMVVRLEERLVVDEQ